MNFATNVFRFMPGELLVALCIAACSLCYMTESEAAEAVTSVNYIYIVNKDSNSISQYAIGTDGRLTPLSPESVAAGDAPHFITLSPDHKHAYVLNAGNVFTEGDDTISYYSVTTDGQLMFIKTTLLSNSHFTSTISFDASGTFAYVTDFDTVTQYSLTADGQLGAVIHKYQTGIFPVAVTFNPNSKQTYIANHDDNTISQYFNQKDGKLSPIKPKNIATGYHPKQLMPDSSGKYLYASTGDFIYQYTIDKGRGLSLKSKVKSGESASCSRSIALHPNGMYAYFVSTKFLDFTVQQYNVDADGSLTPMKIAAVKTGGSPWDIAIDPTGNYVYVVSAGENSIYQYSISEDGELLPMTPATVTTGKTPYGLAVH